MGSPRVPCQAQTKHRKDGLLLISSVCVLSQVRLQTDEDGFGVFILDAVVTRIIHEEVNLKGWRSCELSLTHDVYT